MSPLTTFFLSAVLLLSFEDSPYVRFHFFCPPSHDVPSPALFSISSTCGLALASFQRWFRLDGGLVFGFAFTVYGFALPDTVL